MFSSIFNLFQPNSTLFHYLCLVTIGVLHAADLSGSGTIELASIKSSQLGGDLYLDLAGLYIESTPQIQAAVTQVTENGVTKVLINYETVPEPATATLSLLGLGGLLLRRKRQ